MTFQAGQSGNPKGRPRGTRDRITEAFLRDMESEWRQNGPAALTAMRERNPGDFVKVVASLLPKNVELGASDNLIDVLKELNAIRTGASLGTGSDESAGLRDGPVEGHA